MTVDDVRKAVAEIADNSKNDEMAHIKEDQLYISVLTSIAEGRSHEADLAREALKARELDFARWCS